MYYSIQAKRHKSHFGRRVYNGMYFNCLVLTYKASIILIDFDYGTKCHLPSTQIQKMLPSNPKTQTPIHKSKWDFSHWRFVLGISWIAVMHQKLVHLIQTWQNKFRCHQTGGFSIFYIYFIEFFVLVFNDNIL